MLAFFQLVPIQFQEELAEELGVNPSFWRMFFRSPQMAYNCRYGPALPVIYRLVGPGTLLYYFIKKLYILFFIYFLFFSIFLERDYTLQVFLGTLRFKYPRNHSIYTGIYFVDKVMVRYALNLQKKVR